MNRYHLLVAIVGTAFAAGCASADKQAAVQDEDKTYVTGSRIPVRSGIGTSDVKAITGKQDIHEMLHRGGNATGGVTGAEGR